MTSSYLEMAFALLISHLRFLPPSKTQQTLIDWGYSEEWVVVLKEKINMLITPSTQDCQVNTIQYPSSGFSSQLRKKTWTCRIKLQNHHDDLSIILLGPTVTYFPTFFECPNRYSSLNHLFFNNGLLPVGLCAFIFLYLLSQKRLVLLIRLHLMSEILDTRNILSRLGRYFTQMWELEAILYWLVTRITMMSRCNQWLCDIITHLDLDREKEICQTTAYIFL